LFFNNGVAVIVSVVVAVVVALVSHILLVEVVLKCKLYFLPLFNSFVDGNCF